MLKEQQTPVHAYATALSKGADEMPASECGIFKNEALLSALLRASLHFEAYGLKRRLVPMAADVNKLRVRMINKDQGQSRLGPEDPIDIGALFIVPTAALSTAQLAEEAVFFSLSTRDLNQFDLVMDCGNPAHTSTKDALPSNDHITSSACSKKRRVAVCGTAAYDQAAARFPIGLGVTELAGTPAMSAPVKTLIRTLRLADSRVWAGSALNTETSTDVRYLLSEPEEKMPTIINGLVSVSREH
ncbi:putative PEP-binding protein [Pseudovibrio japonicus]|nr:putative PEP-binding protein [Pseudovibrio japonicus]